MFKKIMLVLLLVFATVGFYNNAIASDVVVPDEPYTKQIKELRKKIATDLNNADNYISLGRVSSKLDYYKEDIKEYQKAVASGSDIVSVHRILVRIYYNLGRYSDAAEEYQKADIKKPSAEKTHYLAGRMLADQYKDEEAVKEYKKAIVANPHELSYNYYLGVALMRLYRYEEATVAHQKILDTPNIGESLKEFAKYGLSQIEERRNRKVLPTTSDDDFLNEIKWNEMRFNRPNKQVK